MKLERGTPDGAVPDRSQSPQHCFGVSHAPHRAENAADQRQRRSLGEEETADLSRKKTQCQQSADFGRALLESELEEECHQQQRCDNQKNAEPQKKLAEILRLLGRLERLLADRLEAQTQFRGIESCEQAGFET